jgi:hypothetical protein
MSDKDKLVILILFFVFLASFFAMFKLDAPDVSFFQYLFFIAALTMAFTGFLGATGTFNTTGQTLGGGAAIFLVMVVAVVGLKPYFDDNSLKELVLLMKSSPQEKLSTNDAVSKVNTIIKKLVSSMSSPQEKLSINEAVSLAISRSEDNIALNKKIAQSEKELASFKAKQDKLSLAIRYSHLPYRPITDNDDLLEVKNTGSGQLEFKEGKYEFSTKDLQNEFIYIKPRTDNLRFGPEIYLKYDYNIPEIQFFVKEK